MDPITAIGLASSIAQLLEFGGEIVKRLHEFTKHTGDIPPSFREVTDGLGLLLHSIENIKRELDEDEVDDRAKDVLLPVIRGCSEQAERLSKILKDTLPATGDSQWTKASKALTSFSQDKKVQKIRASLAEYRGQLQFYKTTSPTKRFDADFDRQRPSIQQAVSTPGSIDISPLRANSFDRRFSYPRPLKHVQTASSIGSPVESVFDSNSIFPSNWSIRSASTALTDITSSTATPNLPQWRKDSRTIEERSRVEEPSQISQSSEDAPLLMPEPAIDRPQKIIEAKINYTTDGKWCSEISRLEFVRMKSGKGGTTSILWTGISGNLWIYHSLTESETQYPHTDHQHGDSPTTHIVSFLGRQVLQDQKQSAPRPASTTQQSLLALGLKPPSEPTRIFTDGIDYSFDSPDDLKFFRSTVFGKKLVDCVPTNEIITTKTECETEALTLWESRGARTVVFFAAKRSRRHIELELAPTDPITECKDRSPWLVLKTKVDLTTPRSASFSSSGSISSKSKSKSKDKEHQDLKVKFGSVQVRDNFAKRVRQRRASSMGISSSPRIGSF